MKRAMRIAQVTCSLMSGGAEKLATDLSIRVSEVGHSVDLITVDRFYDCEYQKQRIERLSKGGVSVSSLDRNPGSGYRIASALVRLIRKTCEERYDIVHSHLQLPHLLVAISRLLCPHRFQHVITVHNSREEWSRSLKTLCQGAETVCCSNEVARSLNVENESLVIGNGVDLTLDILSPKERAAKRKELGIPQNAFLLISVGRLETQKNYLVALEALAFLTNRHPNLDFHYIVCGTGSQENLLRKHSELLGLTKRLHLLGNRDDIQRLLSTANCFLSTSLHEGLPLAVLEALVSGAVCALSPIPEHHEIGRDMPGVYFGLDLTGPSMASAVMSSLERKECREALYKERTERLRRFSFDECAESYESLYRRLVLHRSDDSFVENGQRETCFYE